MEGAARVQLDETAKHIIEQLQQDGRRSYAAIGKAVGLSEAAVRQRVQKLLDTGVMQIVGVTDPLMLGFSRQMMIGVKCEGDLEKIADELAYSPRSTTSSSPPTRSTSWSSSSARTTNASWNSSAASAPSRASSPRKASFTSNCANRPTLGTR